VWASELLARVAVAPDKARSSFSPVRLGVPSSALGIKGMIAAATPQTLVEGLGMRGSVCENGGGGLDGRDEDGASGVGTVTFASVSC
jgi:hypothetical protein